MAAMSKLSCVNMFYVFIEKRRKLYNVYRKIQTCEQDLIRFQAVSAKPGEKIHEKHMRDGSCVNKEEIDWISRTKGCLFTEVTPI